MAKISTAINTKMAMIVPTAMDIMLPAVEPSSVKQSWPARE
jgi:hypothetical protein